MLAAGAATRYRARGGPLETKLVAPFRGEPMVRHVVRAAGAAGCTPIVVVTGHAAQAVRASLAGCPVRFVHNPAFATGLASSLRAGLPALGDVELALILLGDMPLVQPATIAALVAGAAAHPEVLAVVPVAADGERGNPVLLRRALFPAAMRLTGDEGARRLLRDPTIAVLGLPVEDEAVRRDFDEPGDFPL